MDRERVAPEERSGYPSTSSHELDAMMSRHAAFWDCAPVERPLVAWWRWPDNPILDFKDLGLPEGDGELEPEMLVVERLLPQFEASFALGGPLDGDLFWQCLPTRFMPWLEAILGSPIHFENTANSKGVFAEGFIRDWNRPPELPKLDANPWFDKLTEFVTGLVRLSDGRFPVTAPQRAVPGT